MWSNRSQHERLGPLVRLDENEIDLKTHCNTTIPPIKHLFVRHITVIDRKYIVNTELA
jgi:hypothetical protein